jgi:hypothetical protein
MLPLCDAGTVLITFKSRLSLPPYRIENATSDVAIWFAQVRVLLLNTQVLSLMPLQQHATAIVRRKPVLWEGLKSVMWGRCSCAPTLQRHCCLKS